MQFILAEANSKENIAVCKESAILENKYYELRKSFEELAKQVFRVAG